VDARGRWSGVDSRSPPSPQPTGALSGAPLGDSASGEALARLLDEAGRLRAERAAAPDLNRAVGHLQARRYEAALNAARAALKTAPNSAIGWHLAAIAHEKLEAWPQALEAYQEALSRDPDNPSIGNDLGRLAYAMRMFPEAERLFRAHQAQSPGAPESAVNLGNLLREQARFQEAIDVLKPALMTHPEHAGLWNALGAVMSDMGESERAVIFFSEALRLAPELETALYNRATALALLGQEAEALEDCRRAAARAKTPEHRTAMRFAESLLLLGAGCLAEGWAAYEARLDPNHSEPIHFLIDRPRWTMQSELAGKRLLLIGEQGLGDEVLFANALEDVLAALGPTGRLLLAVEPRLVPLFQRSYPQAEVGAHVTLRRGARVMRAAPFVGDGAGVDLWAPLASPLRRFRRTAGDFPERPGGFLKADPQQAQAWRARLAALPGRKVGLVWASLVMSGSRSRYFSPFEAWAPVLRTPGVTFVNLQYGDRGADLAYARERLGVEIVQPEGLDLKADLDGVAALAGGLDLVLGVSNASFNIAAACGAPAWLTAPAGLWTQLGTARHPWYSQVRAFRAPAPNAWEPLMAEVAEALQVFADAP
jgi:tetratricopeptide (TPR) repeat protein